LKRYLKIGSALHAVPPKICLKRHEILKLGIEEL
jgi:hypothetical protein